MGFEPIFRRRTDEAARPAGDRTTTAFACLALACGMTIATTVATPVEAQQADGTAVGQAARAYAIPAGPLAGALNRFADESGLQLVYDSGIAAGLRTAGVQGSFTPQDALSRLLAGTALAFDFSGPGVVRIFRASERSGATVLDPITIAGQGGPPPQAEIGNLPPVYAGGDVARGGRVGMLGERDIMDTPFSQTSYTSQLIEDRQARSIGEIVESDPSVSAAFPRSAGIESFDIRGFSFGTATQVQFSGLYGLYPYSTNIAAEPVERIEILKGPSALLNGISPFGAVGGSINLVPKRAGAAPLTRVTADYASPRQVGGHADIGRRFGRDRQFGVRFNGVLRDGDTAIDRQSEERQLATLGLDYQGDRVRLSGDLGYQRLNIDVVRRPISVAAGVPVPQAPEASSNWSQSWTYNDTATWNGALRGEVDILENLTAHLAAGRGLAHNRAEYENLTVQDSRGTLTGSASSLSLYNRVATVEGGLRGDFETGPVAHDVALSATRFWFEQGYTFGFSTIASNLYDAPSLGEPVFGDLGRPGDAPKSSERDNSGLALADTMSLLDDRILATFGARWQRVTSTNFSTATGAVTSEYDEQAITPAVGLVVKPWRNLSVYANYIEGLSEGSIAPAPAANAGEIFPPTVSKQFEAGVKLDTGRLRMTFSAFQITRPNAFTDPSTNVFGVDGEQRNRGLEFTAFGVPADGIRVLGGAAYLDARLTKTQGGVNQGNRPAGIPVVRGNLRGEWDTPFMAGLTLSADLATASSWYVDQANTQKADGWVRVDLGARYAFDRPGWRPIVIRAEIRNLADADYWIASGSQLGLSEPRTFLLSTSFDF